MKIRSLLLTLVLALSFALAACDFDGGVEQGRCVAFDPAAQTVTIVVDTTLDPFNPHYSGGVEVFKMPTDPRDIGPLPVAGGRLMLELEKSSILLYNPNTGGIEEMAVKFTDVEKDISDQHPKLLGKTFPLIDKEKKSVTVYSRRLKSLVTFTVPEEALDLPPYTWTAGHEVRVAFRKANKEQAIRIMNVTKTNIFKK